MESIKLSKDLLEELAKYKGEGFDTVDDYVEAILTKLVEKKRSKQGVTEVVKHHSTSSKLKDLEAKSIYIIREAFKHLKPCTLLWSIGKDSTTLLWLIRKAFYGKVPFPVLHLDTTFKFPEMYAFREHWAKEWNLDLKVWTNQDAVAKGVTYETHDAFTCCHELKTVALQQAIEQMKMKALFVGIRRDEHGIRSKERYFSPRNKEFKWDYKDQPPELWDQFKTASGPEDLLRVPPLLHWTELDVWEYIKQEGIPICKLYFAKNGKRYRSLGCMPITKPVPSHADDVDKIVEELRTTTSAERAGRSQDKETSDTMQRLRALGYM